MSWKIGCPLIKLSRQPGRNVGKHTGKLQSVLCEGWECGKDENGKPYRFCSDADYRPEDTVKNRYIGIRNAFELGKQIEKIADDYSEKRRAAGGRGLRETAAIGFAGILKPPEEWVNGLEPKQQRKLANDLWASFKAVAKDYISLDYVNAVWQMDESGPHMHYAGAAITPDGKLDAAAIVNPKFFRALNQRLPAEMRQRGWDVSDCVNYDPDKAKHMTPDELAEYKAECKAKRPASGRSSAVYKADKAREQAAAAEAEADALREQLAKALQGPWTPAKLAKPSRGLEDINAAASALEGNSGGFGMSF